MTDKNIIRCDWVSLNDPLYVNYHDKEWGIPSFDDRHLFTMLCLEGAQAGLSWITILRKRDNYMKAFDQFNPEIIASYSDTKIQLLLQNSGIVRNRLKINAVITNAQKYLHLKEIYGSFQQYIWKFVEGKPKKNSWTSIKQIPSTTLTSDAMSKDLKQHGFRFVGSTICYSFMQAVGMVNDHITSCFCYEQL